MRTAFGQRRKMLRRSLAERVTPEQFAAAGDLAGGASRATRRRRLVPPHGSGVGVTIELIAPAKLTLGLRITGRRDDGYHLIDAEMVSLDLARHPDDRSRRRRRPSSGRRPVRDRRARSTRPNLVSQRAARSSGAAPHVTIDKRIPHGGGLGGGSSDAAAVLRWGGVDRPRGGGRQIGADVAFCLVGGRARVQRDRRDRRAAPVRRHAPSRWWCRRSHVSTPAVYRAWDELGGPTATGPNDLEPAAHRGGARVARAGATGSASCSGERAGARRERRHVVRPRASTATPSPS